MFSSIYFIHSFYKETVLPLKKPGLLYILNNQTTHKNYVVFTPGCRIPKYDPFDFTVRRYFIQTPYVYNCGPKKAVFEVSEGGVVSVAEDELYKQYKVKKNQMDCYF
ncbi:uncharacterized protein CEXT_211101 [Caerostris extrusa]|uniref:Uncharacterized protein n=1 Tax=Caerostris extrusa TaxID=172846 RepID=A0AAV4M5Y8_CAEEX|nr:uncharacterized protein CEXT_211101 [Caerostris extrusa]